MSEQQYCVVWERRRNRARAYQRKMDAIYDHVRFRKKQGVWFLEGLTAEQVKDRVDGKVLFVGRKNNEA